MLGIKTQKQKLREETSRELIEAAKTISTAVNSTGVEVKALKESVKVLKESLSHLGDAVSSLNEMIKIQETHISTIEEGMSWTVDESIALRDDFVNLVKYIRKTREDEDEDEEDD
jgi:predicted  nucleic acid-binding Zn-ribbon protein